LKVVVDKQLAGWKGIDEPELLKRFDEIQRVGLHRDLPQRISDEALGSYCKRNDCALITSDSKAYTHFFERGTETINIKKYGHNIESDQPVYIITLTD